jgi:RNA polymerase sigma-70 factor (ECF subfamily)
MVRNIQDGPPSAALAGSAGERRRALAAALVATGEEDREAFRLVYRLTSAKLFGICLRICAERQAAEDVLQDVYLQVWRRAGGYDPARSSPITWLATIARNRAIDWRRAHRLPAPAELPELPDPAPDAEAGMIEEGEAARLLRCLEELEPQQRSAIRTAFFDGLTYGELALRRGIPLGTMKSVIRRGLIKMRGCLSDDR